MTITPNDIVQITRSTAGPATNPRQAAQLFAVVGTAAAGTVNAPFLTTNDRDPSATYTAGPVVEVSEMIASLSGQAVVPVRAATAAAGAYGSLELGAFTGTADVSLGSSVPYLDGEAYVIFTVGGTLGVAADGITYQTSPDGGRTLSAPTALGAGTSITIAPLNVTIELSPAGLFALVDECVDDYLAHIADGTSHSPADTINTISTAPVTTMAEVYAKATAIKAAAIAHANNTGDTFHDITDATFAAAVTALVVPTTPATAVTFWNAYKAAYNAHRTAVGVHPANDVTNVVIGADAAAGTIIADDVIEVPTTAPTLDASGLTAALAAINAWKGSLIGGLVIVGAFDPSVLWSALVAGLDNMRAAQLPIGLVVLEARPPTDVETPTTYRLNLAAEWAAYQREGVYVCAGKHGRLDPATLRRAAYQYERSQIGPFAARCAALDFRYSPGLTANSQDTGVTASGPVRGRATAFGGPLAGYRVYDTSGNLIGHDEAVNPGLAAAGFGVITTYRHAPAGPTAAHVWQPKTKVPAGNRTPHVAQQRVLGVIEGVIYRVGTAAIEGLNLYTPGQNTIRSDLAAVLDGLFYAAIIDAVGDPATGVSGVSSVSIEVDRNAVIDPDEPIIQISGEIVTAFYTAAFTVDLQVNQQ